MSKRTSSDIPLGRMSTATFPSPAAEIAEMNRIQYEMEYTEGINQRMRVPEKLKVAPQNADLEQSAHEGGHLHASVTMQVPERIVVAGNSEDIPLSRPPDLDLLQSTPFKPLSLKTPPRVISLSERPLDFLDLERGSVQTPQSEEVRAIGRLKRERSMSENATRQNGQLIRNDSVYLHLGGGNARMKEKQAGGTILVLPPRKKSKRKKYMLAETKADCPETETVLRIKMPRYQSPFPAKDDTVTPSPQQVRVCPPQMFPEDGSNFYSARGILSLIQSSTRRAYQQVLDVLDENRRPVLRGGSSAATSSNPHHDNARYALSNMDTSFEGTPEDMTVVDAASLRRQIIKLNRRLQLLEEENKERAKREMIMYSITVAFWLLNSWLWFRR